MRAIRINYHQRNRLPLVTGPVTEAFAALKEGKPDRSVFFRSGWLYGPHIDLCILDEQIEEKVIEAQLARIRDWIDANPSTENVSEAEYLATAKKLGSLEGVPGPYLPLRPDNTVELSRYRAPRLVDDHDVLQPAFVEFFSITAPSLLKIAQIKQRESGVATMLLVAMLARAADQFEPYGIARGYISLRAHADFFFANYDRNGASRARFDALAARWRSALVDAIGPAVELGRAEGLNDICAELLAGWSHILVMAKAAVRRAAETDRRWFDYSPDKFPEQQDPALIEQFRAAGLTGTIKKGATLEAVLEKLKAQGETDFFASEQFQTFRIILNMFYSLLPAVGVSPAERFGLCHMVATTVEAEMGR